MTGNNADNHKIRFINPYNFIPFVGNCERSESALKSKDCYTGYFDCELKLLTPLFIPNTSSSSRMLTKNERQNTKGKKEKWKGYDFFSYDDWSAENEVESLPMPPKSPVIPGSEIRGAVRSVYEAAFKGCMSSVSLDKTFSRRRGNTKPTHTGGEAFAKTVGALLESNGGYGPCTGKKMCPACWMFGMVGKTGTSDTYACSSKVRVTDAQLMHTEEDSGKLFEKPIILPELGEPKPCAVEFYTKSPYDQGEKPEIGEGYWTYDYKVKYNGVKSTKVKLALDGNQPKLRGRKFYWHSNVDIKKFKERELSAMKQRIRPMRAQNPEDQPLFCFRVYFEQMGKEQLKQLKWSLDFGNSDCAHKIGRAKPLGFGSVRITANKLFLRRIDNETGTWTVNKTELEQFFEKPVFLNEAMKTVLLMANWKERPKNVEYPSVKVATNINGGKKNSTASHQWFKKNKELFGNLNFSKVLPEANEEANKNLGEKIALYRFTVDKRT